MKKDRLLHKAQMAQVFRETSESGICWMDEVLERGEHQMCRNCYESLEEGLPPNRERCNRFEIDDWEFPGGQLPWEF